MEASNRCDQHLQINHRSGVACNGSVAEPAGVRVTDTSNDVNAIYRLLAGFTCAQDTASVLPDHFVVERSSPIGQLPRPILVAAFALSSRGRLA